MLTAVVFISAQFSQNGREEHVITDRNTAGGVCGGEAGGQCAGGGREADQARVWRGGGNRRRRRGQFQRRRVPGRWRANHRRHGPIVGHGRPRVQGARAHHGRSGAAAAGQHPDQLHLAGAAAGTDAAAGRQAGHGAGHGQHPAHVARAKDGRLVVDGQHRRLKTTTTAPAKPAKPPTAPPPTRAPSCAPTTPGPKWPTRSNRWAANSWRWTTLKKAPAPAATPRSCAKASKKRSAPPSPSKPKTSTSSSPPP